MVLMLLVQVFWLIGSSSAPASIGAFSLAVLDVISSRLSSGHSSHVMYTLFYVLMHEIVLFFCVRYSFSNCLNLCYFYNCCFICMDILPKYMSTHASHVLGAQGGQKRELAPLELELDKCEASGRFWNEAPVF